MLCAFFLFLTTTLWDQNSKLYLADERTKARVPMAKRDSKKQRCIRSSPHPSPNCNHFHHYSNPLSSANTIICCLFIMRNIWADIELGWSPFRHWTKMIEIKKVNIRRNGLQGNLHFWMQMWDKKVPNPFSHLWNIYYNRGKNGQNSLYSCWLGGLRPPWIHFLRFHLIPKLW